MRIESTTVVMPRDIFEDRLMRSKSNRHKREDQICEGITIADLEEQRIRGGVRLGVERGRMPESSLMETTESLVEKLKLTTGGKLKNAAAALLRIVENMPEQITPLSPSSWPRRAATIATAPSAPPSSSACTRASLPGCAKRHRNYKPKINRHKPSGD